ncbi:hypothetical protein [uncultured Helicobacter sp.]|uniref:hypothetical protein n=1 Tax=uncultured Helicobacter sp. TaxID=175537 RepID=UPI00374F39D5
MLENTNHFLDNYHSDTNNLTKHIASQLPKEIGNDDRFKENTLDFYTLLDSLHSHNAYYTYVDSNDIENLGINDLQDESKLGYFYCLYYCNPLIVLDNKNKTTLNSRVITQNFGYKDDFYLSFIANKDSLSNEYLQARKALYKTMINLREEREQKHKEEQDRISRLSYEEYKEKQREKERQERLSSRNTINKDSHLILESNDRNNIVIFLDSANSLSNLIHIHNERIDIFTKDSTRLDIQELESLINKYNDSFRDFNNTESNPIHNTQSDNDNIKSKTNNTESNNQESRLTLDSLHSANTQIFLYSQLLLDSSESPSNPLFFGELDKEGVFIESKPIYHLIGETDYDTKDSKETFTQTLQIFLNGNTLTLLNYSLLDSSLNIKLECTSSESKAIQEREQTQRKQKEQDSKTQDSPQSTALLHPILEDNEIKCPHNGVVKLKSNKGKSFTSKGIPMVLESDLLNAPIIGCANNILTSDSKTFSTNQCIIPKNKAIHAS